MPPSPHTPPGAPSARHTAKEGGHDPTSPAFPASPASASSADVSPFITSPLSAHSPLSSIASPPYLPSSPTPHRGLPDGVSQGQRQRMRAESPGISDSPLSSSPSQLEDSFIVIPPDHPTRAHRHRQSHNQGQHDPRGPSKHWERRLGDASDVESDEGDEEEEAGEGEGTDIETDSTVSTAPGTDLGTETETETDLTLGLEGLSDTSSLGTGGDGDSLAGSLHDWVGGEAVQAARMSGHADAQIAYHRDQHTGGIDAIPNVRPFYNHQQGFKGYPNSPGQSSMDDSYIDAEASDYTYDPTLSPARSATSARALHQATGVNDDGAEDDTGVDANADMDRTPGASQIVVIMPQLSASFSTSSLGSKAGSLTPSGSTYGLLAGKKAGPVVGKVSERHDGVRGQDAGPAVPFREERGEEQEQGRGKQGQVKGLFRFFSPSSAPAHSAPPLPLIRGYTDPTQMRTRTANPAPSARSDPFRLADMPTEHSRDGLAEKYREDKEAAGYKGRGKIPDSWLADARIWAPHAEEVDGTRSEVPDYSVLASRESLWPSTFRKRLDGAGADNGGGEAEGDEFGMVNFGEKLVQCGNQGEGAVVVGNGARRWVVGDIREGKKWSLLALASILSVALLGSFGSKIPLSLLFPEGVLNRTQQAATAGRTPIDVPTGAAASASAGYASTQSAAAAYAAYLTGTGSAESDTAQQTTAANRQTTGFAPMALATQLLPDLEAIKSVFATLTSASNHLTLTDDETVTKEGRRVRYASDGKTLAEDESTASDLMSAGGSQAVGLVTRPSETAVAVSVSMPDKGYKAWAKALRDQIRAQTAVVPTVFTSPVVHHAAAVENTTEQVSLRRTNPFNVFIATTTPIISSASHALLSGAVWTRSIMLTALRSLLDALSEDLARLSTLYNSLHRPNITADIFSPTTHALLAIGAHIGHTADAAAYRVKSLHRAIVSFEETREREHTAAIHYIASELGKKWGDARDSVVLGAREEGEKMMDVARGIKAYLDHLEDASMGAVGQVGKGVRGKWEGAGTRMEGVKKGVREKVQSASQGFVRAVGDGFRKGTGAVVDLADILSSSAPDAVTDQSVFKGEKAEGQVTDDMSTRVHLQKTAWWARQGNRQPQPRATRQYTQRQRVERLPRRWSRRAREPPASGKCGSSTAEKEQGRGRRGSNASGTGTSTGVRGKRRDAALVPAKARLEPYELARIKEMWKGIKRGPRSRFRKVVDQIYHGVMPFVLG